MARAADAPSDALAGKLTQREEFDGTLD